MMSAISEAWGIMRAMGMEYEEIGDVFGKWEIDYAAMVQIWKAGCIIEADYISFEILAPVLTDKNRSADNINPLLGQRAMQDVKKCFLSLRKVVAKCVVTDQVVPALSACLDYFKIATGTDLPTSFYQAELDYFGHHMFDKKGEEGLRGRRKGSIILSGSLRRACM